jgi:hypothetical protein
MAVSLLSVEAATGGRQILPRGRYHVKIAKTSFGTSQNGNPKGTISLRVSRGQFEKSFLFINVTPTEKAMGFLRGYMEGILGKDGFAAFAKGCDGADGAEMAKKVAAKIKKLFESGKLVSDDVEYVVSVRVTKNLRQEDDNTVDSIAVAGDIEEEETEDEEENEDED